MKEFKFYNVQDIYNHLRLHERALITITNSKNEYDVVKAYIDSVKLLDNLLDCKMISNDFYLYFCKRNRGIMRSFYTVDLNRKLKYDEKGIKRIY